VTHLFFECVVVKEMWRDLFSITGITVNVGLFDVSRLWICEKSHIVTNIVHAAALWSVWKLRNDLCFKRLSWTGMQVMFHRISLHLARWQLICPEGKKRKTERSVWSAGSAGAPASTADVAGTWLREIDGTIHQLVIKQLEATWECAEKNNDWDGAIGVLADDLGDGSA
jgi:hypothetical protein